MDMMSIRRQVLMGQKSGGGLPSGYTLYDYVETTDSSMVIDTGVGCSSDIMMQIHMYLARSNGDVVVGASGPTDSNDMRWFYSGAYEYYDFGPNAGRLRVNVGYPPHEFNVEVGNFYIKDLNSGQTLATGTTVSGWSIPYNIQIGHTTNMLGDKIYSVKIYDDGTLVRDYVPTYSINDDLYGLLDTVNNVFYGHQNLTGGNNT